MVVPSLIALRRHSFIELICGTYALPVFEWARHNIEGADWEIVDTVDDPDEPGHPYCPGYGSIALDRAEADLRKLHPCVLGAKEIGIAYGRSDQLFLKNPPKPTGDIVIHPYTRHDWKNCDGVVGQACYPSSPRVVGLPDEPGVTVSEFGAICTAILEARYFVGVLSSWTNFAAIFQKRQIIASFTEDVPVVNPNAIALYRPSLERLQATIDAM
jgi:hypothetical protein